MDIPVFNSASVCEICNDKRRTRQFLSGLPMLKSEYLLSGGVLTPPRLSAYPLVIKPAQGHGGDRVSLVHDEDQWREAVGAIFPQPVIQQQLAAGAGRDLRVYVVFGEIVAGVMRRAQDGFLCNYKKGGHAALHNLSAPERSLAMEVIARFQANNAPLSFAGIDFLYHHGGPVISEVEDVVGSRMLYQVSDINIAGLFLDGIQRALRL
ncbi:MAG: ATP-grasp domain-containing protein [Clostridia bacterium]|nr:ATP-grasp domain-containing protein [Clostridia bacterium]